MIYRFSSSHGTFFYIFLVFIFCSQESLLSGIALVDKSSAPQVVWGFAESDLPEEINERFKVLFQTKAKWTVDDISPYIE